MTTRLPCTDSPVAAPLPLDLLLRRLFERVHTSDPDVGDRLVAALLRDVARHGPRANGPDARRLELGAALLAALPGDRDGWREGLAASDAPDVETVVAAREVLALLPPGYRLILTLRDLAGCSWAPLEELFGRSPERVQALHAQARRSYLRAADPRRAGFATRSDDGPPRPHFNG